MVDLYLRPSGQDKRPFELVLRNYDGIETDYTHVAYVSRELAWALTRAGEIVWRYDATPPQIKSLDWAVARYKNQQKPKSDVWPIGTRVTKRSGSSWTGHVVGYYATSLTPNGYCIESERETGSVQIYPAEALRPLPKEEG